MGEAVRAQLFPPVHPVVSRKSTSPLFTSILAGVVASSRDEPFFFLISGSRQPVNFLAPIYRCCSATSILGSESIVVSLN